MAPLHQSENWHYFRIQPINFKSISVMCKAGSVLRNHPGSIKIWRVNIIRSVTIPGKYWTWNNSQELEAEKFLVSPNPSIDGIFNLNFILKEKMPAKILIFDISGKQVYFNDLEDFDGTFNEKIDLGKNLAKGTYLIQVQQNGKKRNEKLILQ